MLDLFTFGNSNCSQNLVRILNEINDYKINKSVSRFLADNNKIIKELAKIEDNDVQKTLLNIFRESLYKTTIKVPEKVKTHAINILIGKMREDIFRGKK